MPADIDDDHDSIDDELDLEARKAAHDDDDDDDDEEDDEEDEEPEPPKPVHQLLSTWTLWHLRDTMKTSLDDYERSITRIKEFATVEDFWVRGVYQSMLLLNMLPDWLTD